MKPAKALHLVDASSTATLQDYRLAYMSRFASLIGRKEVLTGKAKFGIFGDGKEIAQLALAKAAKPGDWRSGYYRDQTLMFATGATTIRQFFAQLYADTDLSHDPASAGRQMNSHFATRYIAEDGSWTNQLAQFNSAADLSPTASQMAKVVGLGYASKMFRAREDLAGLRQFSRRGDEVVFATIGNASTSEGVFWEALNASGVLQIPLVISVWDDGYGISVPNSYHTTKQSISAVLQGFSPNPGSPGIDIYHVRGWDYEELCRTYQAAVAKARTQHAPCLVHVTEVTQPQGHSTSGSHERYKSPERLRFESEFDGLAKMRAWMLATDITTEDSLAVLEREAKAEIERERQGAWQDYLEPIVKDQKRLIEILGALESHHPAIATLKGQLAAPPAINRKLVTSTARRACLLLGRSDRSRELFNFCEEDSSGNEQRFNSCLTSSNRSPLYINAAGPEYAQDAEKVDGRVIIQRFFDLALQRDPRLFILGEDVGRLGGVNLEFEGLNEKYGEWRVTDTSIREATILGQGIGAAMRGLRPIVDIQYLDYLLYCFQVMSDDLATLHFRSAGGQAAPVIIRTKGHRLEGIWHTGSPLGTIINGVRGLHVCVPRNMTQAAGMYNTLLAGDDPALVIEVLNGYRLKESLPTNLGEYSVALGVPEMVQNGHDITVVTYGACVRVALEAAAFLEALNVSLEVIDVQTLLPFDRNGLIGQSLKKTNALICFDEDVPSGASSYMLQKILEEQDGYDYLDAKPRTLSAKDHRSAYGTDGDYFCKPSIEDLAELALAMMRERQPAKFS